jgi:hypothetical protein
MDDSWKGGGNGKSSSENAPKLNAKSSASPASYSIEDA